MYAKVNSQKGQGELHASIPNLQGPKYELLVKREIHAFYIKLSISEIKVYIRTYCAICKP